MIRPFTLICMASAFGAGLYLYQCKHAAQVLDREIGRTIKQTEQTRERTGMLKAEWALLNEPDRLADLARAHLTTLQTLKPTQFALMSDLPNRLPAPVATRPEPLPAETVPDEAPVSVPVAQAPSPAPTVAPAVASVTPPKASVPTRDVASTSSHDISGSPARDTSSVPSRDVASVSEKERDKPKPEPKVAEAKPAPRPAPERVARVEPHEPMPVRAREALPPTATAEATAPGTVGAAVLRAMRAQNVGYAPPPPPVRAYAAPVAAYEPPRPAPVAAYEPSRPAPVTYAPQATSVLGGRTALPPPVPFAVR